MIDKLNKLKKEGWLRCAKHNDYPLLIWNYTQKTQFESYWNEITLMCRGLVTDLEGNIIARPFKKFFNYNERKHTSTEKYDIYQKADGSLGILFNYKGKWMLASRGSFHSEQAIKGKEMWDKQGLLIRIAALNHMNIDCTYMFEIIYHKNRIVVKYDKEALVFLGGISNETGEDIPRNEYDNIANLLPTVKRYNNLTIETLLTLNNANEEGGVVRYSNGDRCKIKFEDYLKIHSIVTNTNSYTIWQSLKDNTFNSLIEEVPDEFYAWAKEVKFKILHNKYDLDIKVCLLYDFILHKTTIYTDTLHISNNKTKIMINKYRASLIKKHKGYESLLFCKFNHPQSYSNLLLQYVKPEYEKAFK